MSLSSLARDEILRRDKAVRKIQEPKIAAALNRIAARHQLTSDKMEPLAEDLLDLAASQPVEETKATNALEDLVKYIPTESVTLYVASTSALDALTKASSGLVTAVKLYWWFGLLTPVLFILIYAGKRRGNGLPPFPELSDWPWWKLVASTVAFLTWALAVPGGPYLDGPDGGAVAAIAALLVSTLLSIIAAVVEKPAPASSS